MVDGQGLSEHKTAFETYVRSGDSANLHALEQKALSGGSNPDGEFLVPPEIETINPRTAVQHFADPVARQLRTISSNIYKKPMMATGPVAGWVGETDTRTQTGSPRSTSCRSRRWSFMPCRRRRPRCSKTARSTSTSGWHRRWIRVFAAQEGAAFVTGDGNNKPKGFVSYNTVANSSWTWGNIGYVSSGVAGAFPSTAPSDVLVDLIFALKAGYRQNAAFVMNRKTQSLIRKFKDTTNNYIWQPPARRRDAPA